MFNPKISAGDRTSKNKTGNNWVPVQQIAASKGHIFNITAFVRTAATGDRVLWLFDLAAGDATSVDPDVALVCPKGMTTGLEFPGGRLFKNGLLLVVATDEPADANTAPTAASNNDALVTSEYRLD